MSPVTSYLFLCDVPTGRRPVEGLGTIQLCGCGRWSGRAPAVAGTVSARRRGRPRCRRRPGG
ncbi:hypothetical protein [Ornithinimicrobium kibberense]|uniref:hypothetical protein n=1 Tax=Ornithinimicrobium kibberense TaxID=282060 RepID=UPI0036221B4D